MKLIEQIRRIATLPDDEINYKKIFIYASLGYMTYLIGYLYFFKQQITQ